MPRIKGIPAYGLHKPTGQARVRIDGKDVYLGPHGSEESKRKYERIVRKLITDRAALEVRARVEIASDPTISELVASYTQHAKVYYVKDGRQTTEFGSIARAIKAVRVRHGHELVTAFGPLKLKAIRDQWIADGLVRTQVNAQIGRVRRMFAWGVEEELVPPAVLQSLKAIKGLRRGRTEAREGKRVAPVPDAFVDAVRPFVSRQVWAMIELQRLAGMRPEEVCLMRTIDINTSGAIWEYQPRRHKTEHHERERVVPLGPRAQEVLKPWLRTELEAYLFSPREAIAEHRAERRRNRKTKVQPSQRDRRMAKPKRFPGEHYTTVSYGHAIADACARAFPHPVVAELSAKDLDATRRGELEAWCEANQAELEAWRKAHRWHPNQLRHSAATRIRREFGLETAKAVLGHSSVVPTQIYAEQDMDAARRAMERLG
jgi:site-specific recombinase XerD